jgi:hypothetical protein
MRGLVPFDRGSLAVGYLYAQRLNERLVAFAQ